MTTTTAEAAAQPIRVFQDILDNLAGHPQLADLMRQHLLTQELLNLPQVVAQLAADLRQTNEVVAQLSADLRHTNEVVAQLSADLRHTNEVVAQLAADLRHTNEVVAQLAADLRHTNEVVAQLSIDLQRTNEVLDQVLEVQSQHTQDIAELKAGQARLEAGQAKLEAGQAKLETGQENLSAKFLPFDAKKMIGAIAGIFNIRRPVWLDNTDLLNIVDEADAAADGIPENELQSLIRSDLALRAVSKSDLQTRYVLIECTGSITRNDISRARRNADHLAGITECETFAMIIGKLPPENILREAESSGVHCLQPSERVTRVD